MRRLLLLIVLIAGPQVTSAQELGGNYNQYISDIHNATLARAGVRWVRGFVNVPRNFLQFDEAGAVTGVLQSNLTQPGDPDSGDTDVLAVYTMNNLIGAKTVLAAGQPVRVILSLKLDFKYRSMGVPDANSPAATSLLSAIGQLLKKNNLGAFVDILVVGNEPMWETPNADADKYEAFLGTLIDMVDGLKSANAGWSYEIFTGALNRAGQLKKNPVLQKVLKITGENDKVAGIDLHLHVPDVGTAEDDVRSVRSAIGPDKKIISTEFSLVHLWGAHKDDALGDWGTANGYPADMKMVDWLNALMRRAEAGKPIGAETFMSYFAAQNWYPQHWFAAMMAMFARYDLYAVTYGLEAPSYVPPLVLTEKSTLWVLNFVYNSALLGPSADGLGNVNPLVFPDFAAAVRRQQ